MEKIIVTVVFMIGGLAATMIVIVALRTTASEGSEAVARAQLESSVRTQTEIEVISVAVRPGGAKVDAWVKNTGVVGIVAIERSDVFLIQPDVSFFALTYNNDGVTSKTWFGDLKESETPWNRSDTLHITITLAGGDRLPSGKDFLLLMVTPNGQTAELVFGSN